MATSRQEAQWVLRAQCNDREALEALLRSVQPLLKRYLVRLTGAAMADDVLQDVLLILCRKLIWLRNPDLFRPWAYRIASRAAFRQLKKESTRPEQVLDESDAIEHVQDEPFHDSQAVLDTLLKRGFHSASLPFRAVAALSGRALVARGSRNSGNSLGHREIPSGEWTGSTTQIHRER